MPTVIFIFSLTIIYFLLELINGLLFNWKLYLMSDKKFYKAGIFGALSTLLFILSLIFASIISSGAFIQDIEETKYWIIPLVAFSAALGNFLSAILVSYFRK